MNVIFRIRTIIAVMGGVLAIAVPAATANAATPAAPAPANGPFTSPDVGALAQPYRDGINATLDGYQAGTQAILDGWTAGANAAASGWQMGVQGLQAGVTDLQAANQAYGAPALYPAPIWVPTR